MISFATSQYLGSRLGYRGWVYDLICNLSILWVTTGVSRMGANSQYNKPPRKTICIRSLRSGEAHSDCSAIEAS